MHKKEKITVSQLKKLNPKTKYSAVKKINFFILIALFYSSTSLAQCAMCRAVLESEEGGVKAQAVNDGIVYLMAFPYILVGIIGYIVYKSRQKKTA